jgi:choline dehydrogenase-like flavoprotein
MSTPSQVSLLRFAVQSLLALALLPAASSAVEPSTDHDVVIVGAGAAGLYAAYTLDNLGYDVIVLEATNFHGGRIWSMNLGDVRIENGAEELYGMTNNFVFNDIKAEYGAQAQVKIFQETPQQDTLIVMDADGLGGGNTCWSETGNCDADADINDYWDFYYATGNYDNHPTDELLSDFLDTTWGVPSTSRGYHLYEAGSPGGEYGTTVERLGVRSLSREWNSFSLTDTVYGLSPTGYRDALDTLYFDQVLPFVTYNSPVLCRRDHRDRVRRRAQGRDHRLRPRPSGEQARRDQYDRHGQRHEDLAAIQQPDLGRQDDDRAPRWPPRRVLAPQGLSAERHGSRIDLLLDGEERGSHGGATR